MGEPAPIIIPIRGDTGQLEEDIANAGQSGGEQAGSNFASAFSKTGLVLAAGGAGLEKFARSTQDATLQLTRIAVATGGSRESLRNLAADTSNAGFEVEEVLGVFEELSKQNVTTEADLQRVANVWDAVADATGGNAVELAKAGSALTAFGIDAKHPEEALNALGTVAFHTRDGINGFTSFLEKNGPKLAGYGLSVDDIAAAMVALNSKGLAGRKAQTAFSKAITDSDGNIKAALKTLGVTGAEYDKFSASVKNGGKELDESASAADDVLTPLQKLEAKFQALILKSGVWGEVAGDLAPILVGIGSAMATAGQASLFLQTGIGSAMVSKMKAFFNALRLSNIQATLLAAKAKIVAVATKVWAAAQALLNLVMSANPLVRIALLLIALGAALTVAYHKSETFRNIVNAAFTVIKTVVMAVVNFITVQVPAAFQKVVTGIQTVWNAVLGFFTALPGQIKALFASAAEWLLDAGMAILTGLWNGIKFVWELVRTWYIGMPIKLIGFFAAAVSWLVDAGMRVLRGFWNGNKAVFQIVMGWFRAIGGRIIAVFAAAINWLVGAGRAVMQGLWNGLRAVWSATWGFLTSLPHKLISVFAGAGRWLVNSGRSIIQGLFNGIRSAAAAGAGFVADIGRSIANFIVNAINSVLDLPWDLHIPLPVVPDIGPFTILPRIPLLRDGGLVSGAGTSRSDSIDAKLSDGEYVVNAQATKEWLPLLEAINWGTAMPGGAPTPNNRPAAPTFTSSTPPSAAAQSGTTVVQNYYGPTTSAGRRRELEWTLKYATK